MITWKRLDSHEEELDENELIHHGHTNDGRLYRLGVDNMLILLEPLDIRAAMVTHPKCVKNTQDFRLYVDKPNNWYFINKNTREVLCADWNNENVKEIIISLMAPR